MTAGPAARRRVVSVAAVASVLIVAVLVAIVVAVTQSSDDGGPTVEADGPITILWIGDTTGPTKVYGDAQLAGVKGAVDYFNSLGGIGGRTVEVRAVSDNGDPTTAASVLTRELERGLPTMVWAGSIASDSAAMIPVLAGEDVFAISLVDGQKQCATDAAANCTNQWFLNTSSAVPQQAVADWISDQELSTVGVLEEETTFSNASIPYFLDAASSNDLTVERASFPTGSLDVTPQMQQLKDAGVDVVYALGLGSAQPTFTARASLEWDVPIIFDPSASTIDLTKQTTAENIENAYEVALYAQDSTQPNPGVDTMVEWSKRYADVTALPVVVTSTGWDAVVALNAAITTADGSLDVDDLNRAMLQLPETDELRTLTHRLGYDDDNHQNVLGDPDDYVVVPVGPVIDGQIQAP